MAEIQSDAAAALSTETAGGVAAALSTLVLREKGIDARLFVGSFSAWAADESRAVSSAHAHLDE